MSEPVTVVLSAEPSGFRRFDQLKHPGGGISTIVRIKKTKQETQYTLKKVKWSRYKFINKIIRLYIIIRYW